MTSPRIYPAELAAWWRQEAEQHQPAAWSTDFPNWVMRSLMQLRDYFTAKRPGRFADYQKDPAAGLAYGLYYFPRSYVMVRLALAELWWAAGWRPKQATIRLLDVGAGSGAAGLAALAGLQEYAPDRKLELVRWDHSSSALQTAERLQEHFFPSTQGTNKVLPLADPGNFPAAAGHFDLILAALVLNEIPGDRRAWIQSLIARLAPGGCLLIFESGQPGPAWELASLGAELLADQLACGLLPCPECCTRTAPSGGWPADYWPHEVRRWDPQPDVRRLQQLLHHTDLELRFSFLGVGTPPLPPLAPMKPLFRLTAPPLIKPGHLLLQAADSTACPWHWECSTRGLSKHEVKQIAARWERGDVFSVEDWKPLKLPAHGKIAHPDAMRPFFQPG